LPLKLTVPDVAVNVPVRVKFPETVCVRPVPVAKVEPVPMSTLVMVSAAAAVALAVPLVARVPEMRIAVAGIVFTPLPSW
jgi:hypothetical protein